MIRVSPGWSERLPLNFNVMFSAISYHLMPLVVEIAIRFLFHVIFSIFSHFMSLIGEIDIKISFHFVPFHIIWRHTTFLIPSMGFSKMQLCSSQICREQTFLAPWQTYMLKRTKAEYTKQFRKNIICKSPKLSTQISTNRTFASSHSS